MTALDQIFVDIEQAQNLSETRKHWQPTQQGEIDIRIGADGQWFHQGRPFKRQSLVKLFASVLRREDDEYFLVTPVEKLRIQVDDVPFIATLVERVEQDQQSAIVFTTNLNEPVLVDANHSIRIEIDPQNQTPRPYVHCRDGLDALIGRNAFFELLNMADEQQHDNQLTLTLSSLGHKIDLGSFDYPDFQ